MRTITIKGIGNVSVKPDLVVITMSIESRDFSYDNAMWEAAEKIKDLNYELETVGFGKNSVKTTNFNVDTSYENEKDENGNYKRVFQGYVCSQRLKVEFDLDMKLLALALNALSKCAAKPELDIQFTVKDPTAVNEELLKSASENAKEKARILCEASGVRLGDLVSIDYNWGELNIYSHTEFCMKNKRIVSPISVGFNDMDFDPEDIDVRDTVTFVWEIV